MAGPGRDPADPAATLRSEGLLFRALSRHSADVLLVVTEQGRIAYAGESAVARLGWAPEQLTDRVLFDLVAEPDREWLRRATARVAERASAGETAATDREPPVLGSVGLIRGDSRLSRVRVSAMPCRRRNRPPELLVVLRDCGELDADEQRHSDRERWLRTLTRHGSELFAVVRLEPDGRLQPRWLSGATERVLGYAAESLRGEDGWLPVQADDRPLLFDALRRCRWGEGPQHVEYRMRRADGSTLLVESVVSDARQDPEVEALVVTTRDVTERAVRDPLTGLPSRRVFLDRVGQALARAHRELVTTTQPGRRSPAFAVLALDVDRFAALNETLGLEAADELLRQIARRLHAVVGPTDSTARTGPDEFMVLFEGLGDPNEAHARADTIVRELGRRFRVRGRGVSLSACSGLVPWTPELRTAEEVVGAAQTAVREAKRDGRGSRRTWAACADRREAFRLEADLQGAAERGELSLHFQPIVDLDDGAIHAAEALVRWQHPRRGGVSPAEFVPVAEESGLILEIDDWVLRSVFARVGAWRARGLGLRVSINLSAVQLERGDPAHALEELARRHGVAPSSVVIELTESALIRQMRRAAAALAEIREAGFGVALDDFGTGYTALSHLHRFPVDALKIDRSFVRTLGGQGAEADRANQLVRTMVALGAGLGLRVVAEGVETPEQRQRLLQLGCRVGQGFLFARPMPPEELEAKLRP